MTWSIVSDGAVGFSEGQTPPPVEEQLSPHPKPKSKKQQAKEFLVETLKNGPMLAEEVEGLAENEGINHWTLVSARQELGSSPPGEWMKTLAGRNPSLSGRFRPS